VHEDAFVGTGTEEEPEMARITAKIAAVAAMTMVTFGGLAVAAQAQPSVSGTAGNALRSACVSGGGLDGSALCVVR
jgi:hypothetical protein